MAVRVNPSASSLNVLEYLHLKRTVQAVRNPVTVASECFFCIPNCNWTLPAIADLTDSDPYKNDYKDFIISVASGSTVTGTLIKIDPDGTETPTTITDNTYGLFYPLDDLKAGVWGFLLDWRLVASGLGFGKYKFNITVENSASTEIFNKDSVCWQLIPYTCENAHRTVRIETEQAGYFEGGFDYSGIIVEPNTNEFVRGKDTWQQQIRLWGRFYRSNFEYNVDNIVTEERGQEQVQSQTVQVYTLLLDTIQTNISNPLIRDMLQAPEVRISDYNINNIEKYESVRVSMTNIETPVTITMNKNEFHDIKFVEWKQDNVHRYR